MSNFSSGGPPQNALFIRTPDLWLNFTKTPTKIDHYENFLEVLVQFLKVQSSGENSKKEILKLGNFCRSCCALCVLSLILRPKMDPLAKTAPCWPNPKKFRILQQPHGWVISPKFGQKIPFWMVRHVYALPVSLCLMDGKFMKLINFLSI